MTRTQGRWLGLLWAALIVGGSPSARAGLPAAPVEQWRWDADVRNPPYNTTAGSPIVVQTDDDNGDGLIDSRDLPDVVFLAQSGFGEPNLIVIVDGRDGATKTTILDPGVLGTMLAAADLDGDGTVEILAGSAQDLVILALDGTRVASLPTPAVGDLGDPLGIADFDQDGVPEAYSGPVVMSTDGSWSWTGSQGIGRAQILRGSLAIDLLPASPGLELIAGHTIYAADGSVLADDPTLPDGLNAVADLDGNGEPEIILVSSTGLDVLRAEVRLLAPDLSLLAGPLLLQEAMGAYVSGPVVADIDGDGLSELVVPTTDALTAMEYDGVSLSVKWRTPAATIYSATGATAFDFDGDGAAEIVYRDEEDWLILEGLDGSVLHSAPFRSGTIFEMPIVANIDDDPAAEILVPSLGGAPGPQGDLVAFEIPGSCTPRSLWNQQTYHVGNIDDYGAIPLREELPWNTHGTWQAQVGICCRADVAAPLADVEICLGDEAVLDASGTDFMLCLGAEVFEWSDGSGVVGSGPVLRVSPTETTEYLLMVGCDSEPACVNLQSATVVVQQPPVFAPATAVDPSDCSLGLRLDWEAATFSSGSGRYHVYRSEGPAADCADALSRTPVAADLELLSWTDRDTVDGERYVYVVEAEDLAIPTLCLPVGPNGGAATRSCPPAILESGDFAQPDGVDAVLRAGHVGDELRLSWTASRSLLAGEHFHLLKATGSADAAFAYVNGENDLGLGFAETDRSRSRQYFDLRVANGCEDLSADEFPPTGP